MIRLCLFLLFSHLITFTSAQTVYTWNGGNGAWNISTNWSPNGVPTNNDLVRFNNGATQTVSSVNMNITLGEISVTNNTTVTLQHTANRTLTIANGAGTDLQVDAGSSLILGNNVSITLQNSASAIINGLLRVTDETFTSDNTGNSTSVGGTIENTGGTIAGAAGRLNFQSGSTYIHARSGGAIPDASWNASSTCEITGLTSSDASGDAQTFGNLIYNCPSMSGNRSTGGTNLNVTGNLEIRNVGTAELQLAHTALNVDGNFLVQQGRFRVGSNTNRSITVDGNVTVSGGLLLMSSGSNASDVGTLNVAGNFSMSGGSIDEDDDGSGQINFNGSTVQIFSKTGGTISNTINFAILSGATVDFSTSILSGSTGTFILNAGAKLATANANGLYSSGALGCIRVTGTRTYNSGADYEFAGSTTGIFTTSPTASTARDIIINNTSGNVTLSQPIAVTRRLRLTRGELITTTTNIITVNNNAVADSYTDLSFVVGPMIKRGDDDFEYPTGRTGVGLMPIKISNLSGSSDFLAEYKRAAPLSISPTITAVGLHHLSFCEYWVLNRTGTATANVSLYWNPNSICNAAAYVNDLSSIVVAHSNGTNWNSFSRNGGTTGNISSGTVTWNNVNVFSPFALGSTSPSMNPLPVLLSAEKAVSKNNDIEVDWMNLTEKDIFHYIVQRSINGKDFSDIATVQPKSNQYDKVDYSIFDIAPIKGVSYYRIKAVEITGRVVYSKLLRIETGRSSAGLTLYPNPVTNGQMLVALTGVRAGKFTIRVVNANGMNVMQKTWLVPGNSMSENILLPAALPTGIYTLVIQGSEFYQTRSFIIR
jgi:hypothetical protein